MMPADLPRTLAILLLRFGIWIAPHDTLDLGHGMLSELNHVEGNWSALIWAFGGAGVLAKHAMLALILPGSHRRTASSASELFAKEIPMRKPALAVIASCVVASLLFFLAPVFRQAFRVSLAQWHEALHVDRWCADAETGPELDALAKKAEQNRDAEGLAFVANRHAKQTQRARLADQTRRTHCHQGHDGQVQHHRSFAGKAIIWRNRRDHLEEKLKEHAIPIEIRFDEVPDLVGERLIALTTKGAHSDAPPILHVPTSPSD